MSPITLRFLAEPSTVNFGGKVHGGTVMKWIDEAGYACATRWAKRYCVTVSVGSIRFQKPIMIGDLVEVEARLAYTGNTSMNISVEVRAGDMKTGQMEKITECVVVFVAVDLDGKALPIDTWQPETPGDMALAQYVKGYLDLARAAQPTAEPMKTNALTGRDLLAVLVVVVLWGVNFVVMKFALRDFSPFQLGAARYVFAVLPLVLIIKPPAIHWKWVLLYGTFQGVGQFGLLFFALKVGMTAALASVLLQTQVFFTALFGFVLLHERANRPLQIGMLLAALGLGCFALNYLNPGSVIASATTLLGFALTLCAAAMWAMSNIVARRVQQSYTDYSPVAFVVWSSSVAIVPFMVLSLAFDAPDIRWQWLEARWSSWLAVAYLGWVATVLGYSLWTGLLKRHPANKVAPFSLGVPVVGLTTGMLVLGEVITPWQWAGIALVVAALACVMLGGLVRRR